jgi:hypothetical protein
LWLPGTLRRFKLQGGRVVCFFHELYAKGRFPNKTWMGSWLQKKIFKEILTLSDAAITSNAGYLEQMKRYNSHPCPLALAGIGSNVGQLQTPKPLAERANRMAIFGLWASRMRLYEQHMGAIRELADKLHVDEIADIGSIDDGATALLNQASAALGKKFKIYGRLPASEISALLAESLAGIANYDYLLRQKSGIVAAYQAHGVPCILFNPQGQAVTQPLMDDCLTALQVVTAEDTALAGLLQKFSQAGFEEYRQNRSYEAVVQKIGALLLPQANWESAADSSAL